MSLWLRDEVLQPLSADLPCGESLEDTPLLASFDAFRLFGQSAPLNPAPDWGQIREQALETLGKSRDLRVLAHLAAAALRTDGVAAFAESLSVASQWLEQYWAETYPRVDEDAILRRSALNCFADPMAVVDGLRRVPLVQSRAHGAITLRALDIAAGLLQPGEKDVRHDDAQIDAAFDPTLPDVLRGLTKHALEQDERVGALLVRPREVRIEVGVELLQSESVEVIAESLEGPSVSAWLWLGSSSGSHGLGLGHVDGSSAWGRDQLGSASYAERSRGSVRLCRTIAASFFSVASATYSSRRRGAARAIKIRSTARYSKAPYWRAWFIAASTSPVW